MVAGRRFWNLIWFGILLLGLLGLWSAIYWGRRTRWKNTDELWRALGTIAVSVGMLLLLNGIGGGVGQVLLVIAVGLFVMAFVMGRREAKLDGEPVDGER